MLMDYNHINKYHLSKIIKSGGFLGNDMVN